MKHYISIEKTANSWPDAVAILINEMQRISGRERGSIMAKLYDDGLPLAKIAKAFGVSQPRASYIIKRFKIGDNSPEKWFPDNLS